MRTQRIAVVGAGIFGAGAALSLRQRGHEVVLFDPGPLPHPLAESTDISKVVRMEYGGDEVYMALVEEALEGWRRWNQAFPAPVYHEVGVLVLCTSEMVPGGFEHDSYQLLRRRGHAPERLRKEDLRQRFPAWNADQYPDGFYHREAGFAEAAHTVRFLLDEVRRAGVQVREGERVVGLLDGVAGQGGGVVTADGASHLFDGIVVTAGSWTGKLLPELAQDLRPFAQPVFHLRPADPQSYEATRFPVFTADIARLGYYGFPVTDDGIVKIAHHGPGRRMDPDDPLRTPDEDQVEELRAFLKMSLPGLLSAPIVERRLCLYCDTWDGHFWIDRHPSRPGVTVAAGGSGHAFKFAPLIGDIIADVVEDRPRPDALRERFRHRPERRHVATEEAARKSAAPRRVQE